MRYILMVKATEYTEAGVYHNREFKKAMLAYRDSLAEAEVLLAAEEIQPSSTGMRITYPTCGGKPKFQAGPFPVEQALIAEYFLIEVASESEALNWALRMPVQKERGEMAIELRRIEELSNADKKPRLEVLEADLTNQIMILRESKR